MNRSLAALFVVWAGSSVVAEAQIPAFEVFDQSCNANGYVITPRPGAAQRFPNGALLGSKTYLGKSCDAFSPSLGSGQWCWANGGVNVEFSGQTFNFYKMDLYCASPEAISGGKDCSCGARPLPSWK